MKKCEKRFHKRIDNLIVSVYFNRTYLNKCLKYDNGIEIWNYDTISICVSNSKRLNNDWFNGDKRGTKLDLCSTGNIKTIIAITDIIEQHMTDRLAADGVVAIEFHPTDEHRHKAYKKMINKFINTHHISKCIVNVVDDYYLYIMNA